MKTFRPRLYQAAFFGSLIVIALVSVAGYALVHRIVSSHEAIASVVNLAGRQRMLTQRAAGYSDRYAMADVGERAAIAEQIRSALADLLNTHDAILKRTGNFGAANLVSETIDEILFEPPHRLDEQFQQFVRHAQDFVGGSEMMLGRGNPNLMAIRDAAAGPLFISLDALVREYEVVANANVRTHRQILIGMSSIVLLTLAAVATFVFRPLFDRIVAQHTQLIELATTDPLTGCHNRRSFTSLGDSELLRVKRYGSASCLLMVDIDRFKSINDTHGHATGDEVIRTLVRTSVEALRQTDHVGRLGGEEFAAILPETGLLQALTAAEKLRAALEASETPHDGTVVRFTASLSVAELSPSDTSVLDALNRADACLYAAKASGRNRVVGPVPSEAEPVPPVSI